MGNERPVVWNADHADHRRAFATAIAPLVQVLWKRKEEFGMVDARIYMKTLKHVPSAVLVAACERALESMAWFPEPAKLLDMAAVIIEEQRQALTAKGLGECADCDGLRWVGIQMDGVTRFKRCGCWRRRQQMLAEIGEPIKRPALPAAREDVA